MTKFLHMSDIHLNHCSSKYREAFFKMLSKFSGKHVFISGDISDGYHSIEMLRHMKTLFKNASLDYVLGNHDFWNSFPVMQTRSLHEHSLNHRDPFQLSDGTWIVGVDGFYDCPYQNCNPYGSNDMRFIMDFRMLPEKICDLAIEKARDLSKNYLDLLNEKMKLVVGNSQNILLITHVPCFKVKSNMRGRDYSIDGLYINNRLGAYLKSLSHKIVVLCGHTHEKCDIVNGNVRQISFEADYGSPEARLLNTKNLFEFDRRLESSSQRPRVRELEKDPFYFF